MRTVVIGDIHGRDTWKQIVNIEKGASFVFVGDYLDSFNIGPYPQIENFLDIMKFAEDNGAVTLMGNHDFHYTPFAQETYSGFNSIVALHANEYVRKAHKEGRLATMHQIDDILISHAGISQLWLDRCGFSGIEDVNDITHNVPGLLRFFGEDYYGDSPWSSPIWIRPNSLLEHRVEGYRQIVGHTAFKDGVVEQDGIWFIDALAKGEYVVIENGKISKKSL